MRLALSLLLVLFGAAVWFAIRWLISDLRRKHLEKIRDQAMRGTQPMLPASKVAPSRATFDAMDSAQAVLDWLARHERTCFDEWPRGSGAWCGSLAEARQSKWAQELSFNLDYLEKVWAAPDRFPAQNGLVQVLDRPLP